MIIGKNNLKNFTSNFEERFNSIKENNQRNQKEGNTFVKNQNNQYTNVLNKDEMADKAFMILQERFNNGLISLDEFNKKCNELNKRR